MEKKLGDLIQAFDHCKFDECLRLGDQMLKKMEKSDGKKKNTMSDDDLKNFYLVRVGSLASTGLLHEANQLLNQKFPATIISQQSSFLFVQICGLAFDRKIPWHVQNILQTKQKKNIDINRFILLVRKFSSLSRIFLKKFASEKKINDSITQIYLEYLQQLQSQKMLVFKRDRLIIPNKQLNLKFVTMFLEKFASTYRQSPEYKKQNKTFNEMAVVKRIEKSVLDLSIRIAIHEGNSNKTRKLLADNKQLILSNNSNTIFSYLRSLINLNQSQKDQAQKSDNFKAWKIYFLDIFRRNMDLDAYVPIYDYSIEFINGLESNYRSEQQSNLYENLKAPINNQQDIYSFKSDHVEQAQNFLNSLYTQYTNLKSNQTQLKKKDYYKIALKNCLLLLINTLYLSNQINLLRQYLLEYKQEFGKKLTFTDQIWNYTINESIFEGEFINKFKNPPQKLQNEQDKLIWKVNFERIFALNPLQRTLQQNITEWDRLNNLYSINKSEVQKDKQLEKGQRYLSDQILTIQIDSIRKFVEQSKISEEQRQTLYFFALNHLEPAIKNSPHNHDLKLRTIYFYSKLNYHEETIKLLQSLDIKGVQYETLGYLYLRIFINFCTWQANEHLLSRMVKSYQQSLKETIQYSYKALLGISFNQCEQNLCYHQCIEKSYNFLVLLFVLYMKNRGKSNNDYYLKEITERLNIYRNNLSFNADFSVQRNSIDPSTNVNPISLIKKEKLPVSKNTFVDFYGILNNYRILQTECTIKQLMNSLMASDPQEKSNQIRNKIKINEDLSQVYDFSHYSVFGKNIEYKFTNGQLHHQRSTELQLKLANSLFSLALKICDFVALNRKQVSLEMTREKYEEIMMKIKQFNESLNSMGFRQQILHLSKIRYNFSQIISFLGLQVENLSTKKKKIEGQAQKKQFYQELIVELIACVSDRIKIKDRPVVDKNYLREVYVHRDDLLERVAKLTSAQYKKLYKLKV